MTEKEFAEIVASALVMVLRALNKRYGLRIWILTRSERREIQQEISKCDNGKINVARISHYFHAEN